MPWTGALLWLLRHRAEQPLPRARLPWRCNGPARLQRHHQPLDATHMPACGLKERWGVFFRIASPESGLRLSH